MQQILIQSGVENLARHLAPLYLSSPTYNPASKLFLKLPRKMRLLYHNLPEGWEWGMLGEGEERMGSLGPLVWLTQRHTYNLKDSHRYGSPIDTPISRP